MWVAPWMGHTHALGACWKCGGSGRIEAYRYIEAGVCFACDGTGSARNRRRRRQEMAPAPVADVAATLRADAAATAAQTAPRRSRAAGKTVLTPEEARNIAMQSLEEAGRWFKILEDPRKLYPHGMDAKTESEIYGYIGAHVGDSIVDAAVYELAIRRANARVPDKHRIVFDDTRRRAIRAADKEYANINTRVP